MTKHEMSISQERDGPLFTSGETAKVDTLRSIAAAYNVGVKIEIYN